MRSIMVSRSLFKGLVLLFLGTLFSGCSTLSYLFQAGRGQMELFSRSRSIEEVLKDPLVSQEEKILLGEVSRIKKMGEEFGLTATKSYQKYVKLDRDSVVYVVAASRELSFEPKIWWFPIVGSFSYLGWFNKERAIQYADELKHDSWETYVRGASAYSTLGWFRDPVLSTMLALDEPSSSHVALFELVNVILHESVHSTVYVKNQSSFNETLAVFIADGLTVEYLKKYYSAEVAAEYLRREKMNESRLLVLSTVYRDLDALYRSSASDTEKRAQKTKLIENAIDQLMENSTPLSKEKMAKKKPMINNASLIQFQTYHSKDDSDIFKKKLEALNHDWRALIECLKKSSKITPQTIDCN